VKELNLKTKISNINWNSGTVELAAREIMNEPGIVKLPGHKDNKTDL
jgi:hypothetical protein